MEDWKQRVIQEKKELAEKIDKLHTVLYTSDDLLDKIGIQEYILLQKQCLVMSEYYLILQQRVYKF